MRQERTTDPNDRTAIHALLGTIKQAWESNNAKLLTAAFAKDAVFVTFNGLRLSGHAQILEFHEKPFATIFRGCRLEMEIFDVRQLSGKIFMAASTGGPILAGDQKRTEEMQTYIIRHENSRWEILVFQNTPVLDERHHG